MSVLDKLLDAVKLNDDYDEDDYLDDYEIKFSTSTQKPPVEKTTTNKKQVKQKYINKRFNRRY